MILRKSENVIDNIADIHLFKVNNRNSERFEMRSKLTTKTGKAGGKKIPTMIFKVGRGIVRFHCNEPKTYSRIKITD